MHKNYTYIRMSLSHLLFWGPSWFSLGTPVSSTIETDHHYIAEILLKVTLNTITPPPICSSRFKFQLQVIYSLMIMDRVSEGQMKGRRLFQFTALTVPLVLIQSISYTLQIFCTVSGPYKLCPTVSQENLLCCLIPAKI